jgi:hypothetical protein
MPRAAVALPRVGTTVVVRQVRRTRGSVFRPRRSRETSPRRHASRRRRAGRRPPRWLSVARRVRTVRGAVSCGLFDNGRGVVPEAYETAARGSQGAINVVPMTTQITIMPTITKPPYNARFRAPLALSAALAHLTVCSAHMITPTTPIAMKNTGDILEATSLR